MKTVEIFEPGITTFEGVTEKYGRIYDASTLQKVADCPRRHEIRVEENLEKPGIGPKLVIGLALHDGLDFYYAHPVRDAARAVLAEARIREYKDWSRIDRAHIDPDEVHLNPEAACAIFHNYLDWYSTKVSEIYSPICGLTIEHLNLDQVVAARFKVTDEGFVVLGESSLVMKFDVDGEELILAGKPDLPVCDESGRVYVMDHKTTSSYLSDWWAKSHEMANKDRGYMAMLKSLLGCDLHGTIINGIYVGKYALSDSSKTVKFCRYSFTFTEDHVAESLRNQLVWHKTIDFYKKLGYFPQGCAYGGCAYPDICKTDPVERGIVKATKYEESTRHFWDL